MANPIAGVMMYLLLPERSYGWSISFLAETMGKIVQEAQAFLITMKEELPAQADNMFTVYVVNGEPAGVVLPHIEPDTDREGRMFWVGMHPRYRGKGLGKSLHLTGLYRLQNEYNAKTYLGSTQIDNVPMRKIMAGNGCIEQHTLISLNYAPGEDGLLEECKGMGERSTSGMIP